MLKAIDRIQIATFDAEETSSGWRALLGAEFQSEDKVAALGAKRITLRVGRSAVEFLEPDGDGLVADALAARGRTLLFAGGVSTDDFDGTVERLRSKGVEPVIENGQAFFNPVDFVGVDFPLVLSPAEDRPSVGNINYLYEVTLLTADATQTVSRFAELFGLDEGHFSAIGSDRFGYKGALTLFSPDELHRFEIITPYDEAKTMGRFFKRHGTSYYMCYADTSDMNRIVKESLAADAGTTIERPENRAADQPPDQMWLHPPALGGVMMGLSRPSMAWKWSGRPERVQEIA